MNWLQKILHTYCRCAKILVRVKRGKKDFRIIRLHILKKQEIKIVDITQLALDESLKHGLFKSRSDLNRMIDQKGVTVDIYHR